VPLSLDPKQLSLQIDDDLAVGGFLLTVPGSSDISERVYLGRQLELACLGVPGKLGIGFAPDL